MKTSIITLCLVLLGLAAKASPPAVGSVTTNQSFARDTNSGLANTNLDAYEGGILVVMMMTPWCPICQSHAQAVGEGLLDHFAAASRASLSGKNDNGVPIRSILLSTETSSTWDDLNDSFASNNGFQQWGLDARADRSDPRVLLGYFRGGFINSSNLYDWGNDRRRLVVLNLVRDSKSHGFREILINRNSFSSGDNSSARAAINAVQPANPGTGSPFVEVRRKGGGPLTSGGSTIGFGKVKTRPVSGKSITFTITNTGTANLTGIAVSRSGSHRREFGVTGPPGTTLAPGKSASFTVVFTPAASGKRRASLQIHSNAPNAKPFRVKLVGSGV